MSAVTLTQRLRDACCCPLGAAMLGNSKVSVWAYRIRSPKTSWAAATLNIPTSVARRISREWDTGDGPHAVNFALRVGLGERIEAGLTRLELDVPR
jgi:hypothetical protein